VQIKGQKLSILAEKLTGRRHNYTYDGWMVTIDGYVAWEPLGTHLPIVFPLCRKGKTMRTSSFFVCFIFCLSWAKQMSWKNGSAENWSNVPNDFCFLKNSDTSAVMFTTWKFLLIIPYLLIWLWLMKWKVCML